MEETPLCRRPERRKKLPPGGGNRGGDDGGGAVEGLVAAAVTLALSTSCLVSAPGESQFTCRCLADKRKQKNLHFCSKFRNLL